MREQLRLGAHRIAKARPGLAQRSNDRVDYGLRSRRLLGQGLEIRLDDLIERPVWSVVAILPHSAREDAGSKTTRLDERHGDSQWLKLERK